MFYDFGPKDLETRARKNAPLPLQAEPSGEAPLAVLPKSAPIPRGQEEEEVSPPVVVQAPSSTEQRSESDKPKEVHPRMELKSSKKYASMEPGKQDNSLSEKGSQGMSTLPLRAERQLVDERTFSDAETATTETLGSALRHFIPVNRSLAPTAKALGNAQEYVMDRICEHGEHEDTRELLYRVRWYGFPPEADTWEPIAHILRSQLVQYHRRMRLPLLKGDRILDIRAHGHIPFLSMGYKGSKNSKGEKKTRNHEEET
ncbi:unnamed protein product [Agarophyton chilense]